VTVHGNAARLHANESLGGLSEADVASALPTLREVHRYPSPRPDRFTAAMAARSRIPAAQVVVGPGSTALCLSLCLSARIRGAERVVVPVPSFEGYSRVAGMAGLPVEGVPLSNDRLDLDALARLLSDGPAAVVFLPNPNNPTSTATTRTSLRGFLSGVSDRHVVVVDEAYIDYDPAQSSDTCMPLVSAYENLVVLQTASKAMGLAGARLAHCFAQEALARDVRNCVVDYSVPAWVELLGLRRLDSRFVRDEVAETRLRLTQFIASLAALGVSVPPPSANFVWLRLGRATAGVSERAAAQGVRVKVYPDQGIRVSMGDASALAAFLSVLPSHMGARNAST